MSLSLLQRFGLTLSTTLHQSHVVEHSRTLIARRLTQCCRIHSEQNNSTSKIEERRLSSCARLCRMHPQAYEQKSKDSNSKSVQMNQFYSKLKGAINAGGGERDPRKNAVLAKVIKDHQGVLRKGGLSRFLENKGGKDMKEYTVHIKGPTGLQVVVEAGTTSPNVAKTVIRAAANKAKVKFEPQGISPAFEMKGVVRVDLPIDGKIPDEDDATSLAIEVGAEDVEIETHCLTFYCDKKDANSVSDALREKGIEQILVNVELVPVEFVQLPDEIKAGFETFVEVLDQIGDNSTYVFELRRVISNME